MKNTIISIFILVLTLPLFGGDEKFALVIGNSNYLTLGNLDNPTNDAEDIASTLETMGFTVDLRLNADQREMETAALDLKRNLQRSSDAVGFFYYAGHGLQYEGQNYLVPTSVLLDTEEMIRYRTFAVQYLLDLLDSSGNKLNMIVLDACRDNPFSFSRSGTRGLSVVQSQPTGSMIVYATSAGSVAQDGDGRNGTFTSELLKHLNTPGLDVMDIFRRTGAGVSEATNGLQIPAIYSQFFEEEILVPGTTTAVVDPDPEPISPNNQTEPTSNIVLEDRVPAHGDLQIASVADATVYLNERRYDITAGRGIRLREIPSGTHSIRVVYSDGHEKTGTVRITDGAVETLSLDYTPEVRRPTPTRPEPQPQPEGRISGPTLVNRNETPSGDGFFGSYMEIGMGLGALGASDRAFFPSNADSVLPLGYHIGIGAHIGDNFALFTNLMGHYAIEEYGFEEFTNYSISGQVGPRFRFGGFITDFFLQYSVWGFDSPNSSGTDNGLGWGLGMGLALDEDPEVFTLITQVFYRQLSEDVNAISLVFSFSGPLE